MYVCNKKHLILDISTTLGNYNLAFKKI
jgi:hypothetical protein